MDRDALGIVQRQALAREERLQRGAREVAVMLVVDGVELAVVHQVTHVRHLDDRGAVVGDQNSDALDEAVQVGDMGHHVVGDEHVDRTVLLPPGAERAPVEERLESGYRGRSLPGPGGRRVDAEDAESRRARSSAGSRHCWQARSPGRRRPTRDRGATFVACITTMVATVHRRKTRNRGSCRRRAARARTVWRSWTKEHSPQNATSSGNRASSSASRASSTSASAKGVSPSDRKSLQAAGTAGSTLRDPAHVRRPAGRGCWGAAPSRQRSCRSTAPAACNPSMCPIRE